MRRILIVGAGLAAVRVVERLRELGCDDEVVMVGEERHAPYDRPPLSKQVLRGERGPVWLREDWDSLDALLLRGRRAVALHANPRTVLLDDGQELAYDALVIATGASPRTLPGLHGEGVHLLRTLDDAEALRADLQRVGEVAIVGGGFIGCEVAASARALGVDVTLVEVLAAPLARVLGLQVAREVAGLHERAGVSLRCGVSVVEARGEGAVRELLLSDGSTVPAEVVVLGLGVVPATGWLDGSGVEVDDGVVCDAHGRTSVPGVWAAGDVARWWHPGLEAAVRLEHWTTAADQGAAVAADLCGSPAPLADVPYFWSDQHGVKLQVLGVPHPDDDTTLLRVGPQRDRLLALYSRDGRLTAVLGVSAPRWVMRMRPLLAAGACFDDALVAAQA